MEFMGFHVVDMIIVGLILFLAIRGLVNGFSKELFNFLALIGGIAVAARTHSMVGELIAKQNLIPNMSADFQKFVGFAVVLILIVILFNIISSIRTHLRSENPGLLSRVLGYIISVARYVFIFSLIVFGINNADFLKEKLSKHYKESQLFEPMIQIGGKLLNANQQPTESTPTNENNDTNDTNISSDGNISMNVEDFTLTDRNTSNKD